MLTLKVSKGVEFCDGLTRRDFMKVGSLGAFGLAMTDRAGAQQVAAAARKDTNCILLFLVGGPSHLDTWDPKPDAPSEIRGPFRPIHTNVPGIDICEHFPLMARTAQRYALVRSVHHHEAPIHETGHQLMQTGWLFRSGKEYPHYGSVLARLRGNKTDLPPYVVAPGAIGNTGVSVPHGQHAGYLGSQFDPFVLNADPASAEFDAELFSSKQPVDPARLSSRLELVGAVDDIQRRVEARSDRQGCSAGSERALGRIFSAEAKMAFDVAAESDALRERYGQNTFGQSCLLARRLVQRGVHMVTVNMFDTVFNRITWDCHANGGSLAVTLDDYARVLCPMFDRAYSALLEDLDSRGMLENTLVVAMGEFGRTYKLNNRGGRDHWPGVWTILFAGGGIRPGQVVGASDRNGAEPKDRPVDPSQVAATVYQALGIHPQTTLPGPEGEAVALADARAIAGLLA